MATTQERILLLRFSSLGDVVLLTAAIESLRAQKPNAEIWLATKQAYLSLFQDDPRLHRVVALDPEPGGLRKLLATLEDIHFDLILDAHGSLRSRALRALLPPTASRSIDKDNFARLAFVQMGVRSRGITRSQLQRYAQLIGGPSDYQPSLFLSEASLQRAAQILPTEHPVLAIAPGAKHLTKRWPVESFAEVASRFDADLLVLGSSNESEFCRHVADATGRDAARSTVVTDEADLQVLGALLARCRLLLCNDSGLLHLAEAAGTPSLALFGPTSRELGFFPWRADSAVIEHALDCRPCSRTGSKACSMPERWCMTRSTVDLVLSQLELSWNRIGEREAATST